MKTIVVVPVYREMHSLEVISLQQAVRIFQEEPLCLVTPMSLDVSSFHRYGKFLVERFDNHCFQGIAEYSKLLLNPKFYERFSSYDYLLIYQLDAFVFRDALPYFCSLGYDYYGAPWRLTNWCHRLAENAVGNGGLSLRHVRHTIEMLRSYREIIERDWLPKMFPVGEDIFFGWAGAQRDSGYQTCPLEVAEKFAFECDVRHAFRTLTKETLPFGIHKWYQEDFQVWRPYIESCGYRVDASNPHIRWLTTQEERREKASEWGIWRIARRGTPNRIHEIIHQIVPKKEKFYVRGTGVVGERVQALLKRGNVEIEGVLEQCMLPALPSFILVASTRYEEEITKELMEAGRVHGRDFMTAREFELQVLQAYYGQRRGCGEVKR